MGLFDTRTMLGVVKGMKKPKKFFKTRFFGNSTVSTTEKVDIDIVKGVRKVAPFVSPKIAGQVIEREGFSTSTIEPPMIKPMRVTEAETLLKRLAGEELYSGMTAEERAAELLGVDLVDLDDMITRREELSCREALFDGRVTLKGDGVDRVVDFQRSPSHKIILSGTNKWHDPSADPLKDLRDAKTLIIKDSGINPDTVVMATDVYESLINNENFRKQMDMRLVNTGIIDPSILPDGVTYVGRINELGVDLYLYEEWYLDDNGVEQPMVEPGNLIMLSSKAGFTMLYGAYIGFDEKGSAVVYDLERIPRTWRENEPEVRFVQLISRPIPLPKHIDSIVAMKVQ